MGLRQLHAKISPQWDCPLAAKTLWMDPTARSRWGSYPQTPSHPHRRSHGYDCRSPQLSVHLLVLEGGRSPSTPAGFLLQCRWQPGWCESFFYFALCNLDFVAFYVSIRVFFSSWLMFDQTMLILLKHIFISMVLKTDLSAGEAAKSIKPPRDDENLKILVDSH